MATPFRPAVALLNQYAEYHRDRRNILTHFVGVPMIVFAVCVFLAGLSASIDGVTLTLGWVVFAVAAAWYLSRGHLGIGLATTLGVGLLMVLAHHVAGGPMAATLGQWTAWWAGFFIVGWVIQFVGHYYEGRKPAFADDIVGLAVSPMFVVLEMLAPLGLFKDLMAAIEQHAGPTLIRDLAHPAAR